MSERIAEIRERLEKATPGPWEVSGGLRIVDAGGRERLSVPLSMSDNTQARHDADFAANAPMDIAFLLDELAAAKTQAVRSAMQLVSNSARNGINQYRNSGSYFQGYRDALGTFTDVDMWVNIFDATQDVALLKPGEREK